MPGLLQSPDAKFGSVKSIMAVGAEFLGTMLFTFAGTTTPVGVTSTQQSVGTSSAQSANWAPWGNGFALVLAVYATANISGGHLNPAVTAATLVTGHISIISGFAYIIAQLAGACCGILLACGLVPGVSVGMGDGGVGCFHTGTGVDLAQLFGWELVMTFVLVAVVYAVAIGEPSFGNVGPLVVGLALFTMVFAGSQYTGTAINPARAFGPAAVYHCYWDQVWLYAIAEFSGGILAGLVSCPLYGVGNPYLRLVMPWMHKDEEPEGPSGKLVSKSQAAKPVMQNSKGTNNHHHSEADENAQRRATEERHILESHNDRAMARATAPRSDDVV